MQKLKIALFCGATFPAQIIVSGLTPELSSRGHNITIYRSVSKIKSKVYEVKERHFFEIDILEKCIYPFLDSQKPLDDAICYSPKHLIQKYGIELFSISRKELQSESFASYIAEQGFDGAICIRYPFILKKNLITVFRDTQEFLWNIHSAKLPEYRGLLGFRQMMYDELKEFAFTLHDIDEGIDTGAIIAWIKHPLDLRQCKLQNMNSIASSVVKTILTNVDKYANGENIEKQKQHAKLEVDHKKWADLDMFKAKNLKLVDKNYALPSYIKYFSKTNTLHSDELKKFVDNAYNKWSHNQ